MLKIKNRSNIFNIFVTILLLTIYGSCKNENSTIVPFVTVNIQLNLNSELSYLGVGQIVTITRDSLNNNFGFLDYHNKNYPKTHISWKVYGNGILLYRKSFEEYQAYDLTCTYQAYTRYCAIKVEPQPLMPQCPCCKSEFMIQADAIPSNKSKADVKLFKYKTNIIKGGSYLLVSNY